MKMKIAMLLWIVLGVEWPIMALSAHTDIRELLDGQDED